MGAILAALAAIFAYLSWVRMTTKDIAQIQAEMDTRISSYQTPPELEPVIYPTGATVTERQDLSYRILKTIIPFYSAEGGTRIEINVIQPEEVNIYRMRKDAFSPSSSYAGVRASNYDSPDNIVFDFDSINPSKVQTDFFHASGLLVGDYTIILEGDEDLKSIWDPKEQAP